MKAKFASVIRIFFHLKRDRCESQTQREFVQSMVFNYNTTIDMKAFLIYIGEVCVFFNHSYFSYRINVLLNTNFQIYYLGKSEDEVRRITSILKGLNVMPWVGSANKWVVLGHEANRFVSFNIWTFETWHNYVEALDPYLYSALHLSSQRMKLCSTAPRRHVKFCVSTCKWSLFLLFIMKGSFLLLQHYLRTKLCYSCW